MFHIPILLAIGAAVGADEAKDIAAKRDVAFLEGQWVMIAGQRDGQVLPRFLLRGATRTAVGNESTVIIGGRLYMRSSYTLDPTKNPKQIDYDVSAGQLAGQKQQGIYEITGNTVRFCFAAPGSPRPTDFSAPAGSGRSYSAFQKISGPSPTGAEATPGGTVSPGATYAAPAQRGGCCRLCIFKRLRGLR